MIQKPRNGPVVTHKYMIAEELGQTFRPKDMFSKAEQRTKLGQLKYKKR